MANLSTFTLQDFDEDDFDAAIEMCRRMGYGSSHAYCTSSEVPGLYCLPLRNSQSQKVIVKIEGLGLAAVEFLNQE